jgi:hypothetical protein
MPEMSAAQETETVLKNPNLPFAFGSNTSVAELVLPPQG